MKTICGGSITGVPWVLILGSSFQSWLPCLWPLSSFLDSHLPLTSALGIFLSTLLPGLSPSRHGKCWESNVLAWCPCLALSRLSALFQLSVRAPLVLLCPDHYWFCCPFALLSALFWDTSSGGLCLPWLQTKTLISVIWTSPSDGKPRSQWPSVFFCPDWQRHSERWSWAETPKSPLLLEYTNNGKCLYSFRPTSVP